MELLKEFAISKGAKQKMIDSFDTCGDTPLVIAVCHDNPEIVEKLIKSGEDINEHSGNDDTYPLLAAVTENRLENVKCLINNGTDLNLENKYRDNPLISAIFMERYDIAELLMKHGAKVNDKFFERESVIVLNMICGDRHFAKKVIDYVSVEFPDFKERWKKTYEMM